MCNMCVVILCTLYSVSAWLFACVRACVRVCVLVYVGLPRIFTFLRNEDIMNILVALI